MGFEQATIQIENEQEFAVLKAAVQRAFSPENVEKLLKQVKSAGLRIRHFEPMLRKGILDKVAACKGAQQLYEGLTTSDQAQIREFYLFKLEEVDPALRAKYQRIYQYY